MYKQSAKNVFFLIYSKLYLSFTRNEIGKWNNFFTNNRNIKYITDK